MLSSQYNKPTQGPPMPTQVTPTPREIADCYAGVFRHLAYSPPTPGRSFWDDLRMPALLTPSPVTALLYRIPATTERSAHEEKAP
jgi:hypothetical protein